MVFAVVQWPAEVLMPNELPTEAERTCTAPELRAMPREQAGAILRAAAELAEREYIGDPELTAFEAFGEDDLFVDSSSSVIEPR
jgi:hypothetical protein